MSEILEQTSPEISQQELQSATNVVSLLVSALKNSSIYPEEHSITQKFFYKVLAGLQKHIKQFNGLRLDIAHDALLYHGEPIYQEMSSNEDRFVGSLFADGITWITFQEGITLEEISSFFRVINRYKDFQEEADGDLVTALWDLNLPHLYYDATDVLWETDKVIDINQINRSSIYSEDKTSDSSEESAQPDKTSVPVEDSSFSGLTEQEEQILHTMVLEEEQEKPDEDVLDILAIILQKQSDENDFKSVLLFLKEEFEKVLAKGGVSIVLDLLENLHVLMMASKVEKPWAVPLIGKFLQDISTPDSLSGLHITLSTLDAKDGERIDQINRFLSVLEPQAIDAIALFMEDIPSPIVQHILLDALKHILVKEPRVLEQFLKHADDSVAVKIMPVLEILPDDMAKRLMQKYLHHSSTELRRAALAVLLHKKESDVRMAFPLLEDPNQGIRELALNLLSRHRSHVSEQHLLKYIQKGTYNVTGPEHLVSCYRALGRCGSKQCLPFLTKILLNRGWNSFLGFGKLIHRRGAAEALHLLRLPEADTILAQAAKSRFPVIKNAINSLG